MKLWLQSGSALAADKATPYGRRYEESLARHIATVVRPGTKSEVFGIGETPDGKDRDSAAFRIVASLMIESVLRAEDRGFDAVAVINTFDHGYHEMRERLEIPVVFISECSMHLACQLAPTFSFITHNEAIQLHVAELAKQYGLASRMVAGAHLGLTYEDFPKMYEDSEAYVARFAEAARQAIGRGAAMLMVAGNPFNMFLIEQGVREIDGVPILDCCTAAIKAAEQMVDLHELSIRRGAKGLFQTAPPEAFR